MSQGTKIVASQPFGHIIGAPLRAAVEAQALAARTTVDFINSVAFKPKSTAGDTDNDIVEQDGQKEEDISEIRNIVFSYIREGEEGNEKCVLTIPILSIIPIPYLRIEELTLDYSLRVDEQEVSKSKTASKSSGASSYSRHSQGYRWWWGGWNKSDYRASYTNKQVSTSEKKTRFQSTTTMNIHVRAVQDDLPSGISKVLDILDSVIKESRTPV